MALTKVSRGLLSTGIVDNSNATAITLNADESATFAGALTGTSATFTTTVGIGVSSSPAYTLTVQKDVDDFIAKLENDGNSTASNGLWVDTRWNTATNTVFQVTTNSGAQPVIVAKGNGNVGISTTSPQKTLDVQGEIAISNSATSYWNLNRDDSTGALTISDTGTQRLAIAPDGHTSFTLGTNAMGTFGDAISEVGSGNFALQVTNSAGSALKPLGFRAEDIRFATGSSERFRLTSLGDILLGQTSGSAADTGIILQSTGNIFSTVNSGKSAYFRRLNTDGVIIQLNKNSSVVGTISTNANSLPSDRNFKTNISYDFALGLDFVTSLKPVTYNYKIDDEGAPVMSGLIAQDVEESLSAAGVVKNSMTMLQHTPTDDEEQSDYQMDYLKLVPVLINAIKEQQLTITALTERIETLENN